MPSAVASQGDDPEGLRQFPAQDVFDSLANGAGGVGLDKGFTEPAEVTQIASRIGFRRDVISHIARNAYAESNLGIRERTVKVLAAIVGCFRLVETQA